MSGVEGLRKVLALLDQATPGPWRVAANGFGKNPNGPTVYHAGEELNYVAKCMDFATIGPPRNQENAAAIAAAVNWLRTHAPALLERIAALEGDARRYRWLRDGIAHLNYRDDGLGPMFAEGDALDAEVDANIKAALDAARVGGAKSCDCETCQPHEGLRSRMILCAICGNKRCPHATDHRNDCTGSNEPGQPGSSYGPPTPKEPA